MVLIVAMALVVGGLSLNYVGAMAKRECAKKCPDDKTALKTHFEAGPVSFATCVCVSSDAHGE